MVVQTIENHFYQTRSYPGFISLQSALSRSREGTELNTLEKTLDTYRFASLAEDWRLFKMTVNVVPVRTELSMRLQTKWQACVDTSPAADL